ncbi:unnamed protein product [Auanema sp. JU1783]|nr:unnamed protein product [Auanema sp. JU1783]
MPGSRSVSRSRSPSVRKGHNSVSRSPRSRSRSHSQSRSPFASPRRDRSRSRSRSASRTPPRRNRRSRSRSPRGYRGGGGSRRGGAWTNNRNRENPDPNNCVGVFNLSVYTTVKDLREVFGRYGEIEKCELVYDHPTGRSRGFGFIYFQRLEDATAARDEMNGSEVDGQKIRVDYSITRRAHTPTPGQYMGSSRGRRRDYSDGHSRGKREFRESHGRRRSPSPRRGRRSPSPRYDRRRSRSRSY